MGQSLGLRTSTYPDKLVEKLAYVRVPTGGHKRYCLFCANTLVICSVLVLCTTVPIEERPLYGRVKRVRVDESRVTDDEEPNFRRKTRGCRGCRYVKDQCIMINGLFCFCVFSTKEASEKSV